VQQSSVVCQESCAVQCLNEIYNSKNNDNLIRFNLSYYYLVIKNIVLED